MAGAFRGTGWGRGARPGRGPGAAVVPLALNRFKSQRRIRAMSSPPPYPPSLAPAAAGASPPDAPGDAPAGVAVWFDAVLRPNRSLGPAGRARLFWAVAALSAVSALRFWAVGAWPVALFFILDAGLLWGAFKLNDRAGRRTETIRLSRAGLDVAYTAPDGRTRTARLEPVFARVDVRHAGSHRAQVRLVSRGVEAVVGSFLSRDERLEMAAALDEALYRFRTNQAPPTPGG
ncbi:hypothetical protein CKO24_00300 [Rhodothalassium salexigens DSM 2132]|nr:hypothetical protein [Rhodothalassium salexigens DSM 2132]